MNNKSVEVKKDGIYLDGEKFFLLTGDMHYFRIQPDGWYRRLFLMKDFGLTAVTTYVPWNFTEPKPGEYNFEGICDLERFLKTADEVGLKVVLRCSPYLCGEWEMGGLPSWLLKSRTMCLRSSDPEYMEYANRYNAVLCEKIRPFLHTNGGPIILVGLENEYGSYGEDHEYLRSLMDFYKERDINVPFVSANGVDPFKYINGVVEGTWNGIDHSALPGALPQFEKLKELQPDKPLMAGEAWTGCIQFWGRKFIKGDTFGGMQTYFKKALEMGVSINFYMFCGGTNFGFSSGALYNVGSPGYVPLMTSYDYDAPISEEGNVTEKYFALRDVLDEFLNKPSRPHVSPIKWEAQKLSVKLSETTTLFGNIDALSTRRELKYRTVCMEDMDQDYGYICYRTRIGYTDSRPHHLKLVGVADRAMVYVDGEYLATVQRDMPHPDIVFTVKEEGAELTVLVENQGRVNYGYNIYDRKGILDHMHFEIENPDGSMLYNYANIMKFTTDCLPLNNIEKLNFDNSFKENMPVFYKGKFDAQKGVDTFIDTVNLHKGVIWINGVNLGRFWDIGPQRTLYLPGEILKDKDNEIIVLEHYAQKKQLEINFVKEAMLCEEIDNDMLSTEFRLL